MAKILTDNSFPSSSSTPTWQNRFETLTHILTHQTLSPSLDSQLFVSLRVPCFLNWSYPPFLCTNPSTLHKFSLSFYISRFPTFGLPQTSWRSRCPFLQPPPLINSSGIDPSRWGPEERREYAKMRFRRRRKGFRVPDMIILMLPTLGVMYLVISSEWFWRRRYRAE